jgi:hypothetical protein
MMRCGRDAILPHRHAANCGNLRRDLCGGQHSAMPWLGALAELDLNHLDLRIFGRGRKTDRIKAAIIGPAAKIA